MYRDIQLLKFPIKISPLFKIFHPAIIRIHFKKHFTLIRLVFGWIYQYLKYTHVALYGRWVIVFNATWCNLKNLYIFFGGGRYTDNKNGNRVQYKETRQVKHITFFVTKKKNVFDFVYKCGRIRYVFYLHSFISYERVVIGVKNKIQFWFR